MSATMSLLGGGESGITDDVMNVAGSKECCGFKLSWKQRFYGWMICFLVGVVFSIGGCIALFLKDYTAFVLMVTGGTIISLLSSLFLSGPMKQIKNMFKETRYIATTVLFISIILTIVAALALKIIILAILFLIIQELALTWYMLTWIPGARMVLKQCCKSTCDMG